MTNIVQRDRPTALQHMKGFVHVEMAVDRNPGTRHDLLAPQRQIFRSCGRTECDIDIALVTKMNEMFALGGGEHISFPLRWCGLSSGEVSRHDRDDTKTPQAEKKGSAILVKT